MLNTMIRINAKGNEFVALQNEKGFYVAVGAERVPQLHPHVENFLEEHLQAGGKLFATSGGLRLMTNAEGEGGVAFVDKKSAQTGEKVYLLPPATKEKVEAVGMEWTQVQRHGIYVPLITKDGKCNYADIRKNFTNSHHPMKFKNEENGVNFGWPNVDGTVAELGEKPAPKKGKKKADKSAAA